MLRSATDAGTNTAAASACEVTTLSAGATRSSGPRTTRRRDADDPIADRDAGPGDVDAGAVARRRPVSAGRPVRGGVRLPGPRVRAARPSGHPLHRAPPRQ